MAAKKGLSGKTSRQQGSEQVSWKREEVKGRPSQSASLTAPPEGEPKGKGSEEWIVKK